MTTPPTPQPAPLPELVQAMLAATEGHTAGPWAYELDSICHGYEFRDGKHVATWIATVDHENREDYADDGYHLHSPQAARDAALMAAAPDLRALLAETAAALAAAQAREERATVLLERYRTLLIQQRLASMSPDAMTDDQQAVQVGTEYSRSRERLSIEAAVLEWGRAALTHLPSAESVYDTLCGLYATEPEEERAALFGDAGANCPQCIEIARAALGGTQ